MDPQLHVLFQFYHHQEPTARMRHSMVHHQGGCDKESIWGSLKTTNEWERKDPRVIINTSPNLGHAGNKKGLLSDTSSLQHDYGPYSIGVNVPLSRVKASQSQETRGPTTTRQCWLNQSHQQTHLQSLQGHHRGFSGRESSSQAV